MVKSHQQFFGTAGTGLASLSGSADIWLPYTHSHVTLADHLGFL